MIDWSKLPKVVDHLKGRYFFVAWLLLALVLFAPNDVAQKVGFTDFLDEHRAYVGVAFLAALGVWLAKTIPWCWGQCETRRRRQVILRGLDSLSRQERFLVLYCLDRGTRTLYFKLGDGVALGLVNKGLLEMSSGTGTHIRWPYIIPAFVWAHLSRRRDLLLADARSGDADLSLRFKWFESAATEPFVDWVENCQL